MTHDQVSEVKNEERIKINIVEVMSNNIDIVQGAFFSPLAKALHYEKECMNEESR
jgi:ribosomal protein L14E/L6E/L27E